MYFVVNVEMEQKLFWNTNIDVHVFQLRQRDSQLILFILNDKT